MSADGPAGLRSVSKVRSTTIYFFLKNENMEPCDVAFFFAGSSLPAAALAFFGDDAFFDSEAEVPSTSSHRSSVTIKPSSFTKLRARGGGRTDARR